MAPQTTAPPAVTHAPATRIVGIGASAGGLEPLEQFLAKVPVPSHMAYVVVQHLDPTHKALLSALLQRITPMPVHEAQQNMLIAPDCVYVIPPNTELSVVDGRLHLGTPSAPRGLRLPINVLFNSLAGALGEQAIGVVLSGMGADGTLGLQAIKAVGGLTLVQQPSSAQFDEMPASAVASNCADIIADAADMPDRISDYLAQAPPPDGEETLDTTAPEQAPLQRIFTLLQQRTRHDFSSYKPSTLHRRMERRMAVHSLRTLARYADFLEQNPHEIDLLFKELLIGVTHFFRDPGVWDHLASITLPAMLAQRGTAHHLRAWVAGCSTGEEAYSLAMVFIEATEQDESLRGFSLQIFATDLSPEAIATARRGRYPDAIADTLSKERLARFFTASERGYQINSSIRDMVMFAEQDLLLDPPFTKLDLISCRNLLIYFDASLQRRLIPLFHYSLREHGILLLGSAETPEPFHHLFTPIDPRLRLYRRKEDAPKGAVNFPINTFPPMSTTAPESAVPASTTPPINTLQAAADHVLLQVYAPAAVLITGDGDILYISGRTGKYLEPAAGKANWNIHAMAREGLRAPLAVAIKDAQGRGEPLHLHGLRVALPGGGEQSIDVTVQALREPSALRGATMIVFRDTDRLPPAPQAHQNEITTESAHEAALQQCRDEIQNLREEARASREELQSANEELQSTNEELTTSKEEMQSMNEELQTINAEMQTKLDDLALAQSDMKNLLNSIDIAILFLDQDLNVRRYTDRAARLINIRGTDIGRPFSDLTTMLDYPTLHTDAMQTLHAVSVSEKQVSTTDGRWFAVRIMPYYRQENVMDGVVITFVEITETKKLEQALRRDLEA
ncbi:chemotaxis protein CheB [Isoalcanivorax indicus]|uniref:chemotaxis protein CheB n=1 Tax=Isoalcanivorax indicus TaxID=2202653 RepID=UPI000DB97B87|nr:chemotaxis protein CheB [Isoalcanivorax indicus]